MDWFSRYVLSWEVSVTLESDFCVEALRQALSFGKPQVFNTDQGRQFTCGGWHYGRPSGYLRSNCFNTR